jgi:hypothetical protein
MNYAGFIEQSGAQQSGTPMLRRQHAFTRHIAVQMIDDFADGVQRG